MDFLHKGQVGRARREGECEQRSGETDRARPS